MNNLTKICGVLALVALFPITAAAENPNRTAINPTVPAYNEADTIEEVVRRASRHADVCVVDDASNDGTGEIVAGLERVHCIRHERNTHIARGILDGFRYGLEAGYDFCVTMDSGFARQAPGRPPRRARGSARWRCGRCRSPAS